MGWGGSSVTHPIDRPISFRPVPRRDCDAELIRTRAESGHLRRGQGTRTQEHCSWSPDHTFPPPMWITPLRIEASPFPCWSASECTPESALLDLVGTANRSSSLAPRQGASMRRPRLLNRSGFRSTPTTPRPSLPGGPDVGHSPAGSSPGSSVRRAPRA